MNTRQFWSVVAGFAAIALVFVVGLLVGERNFANTQPNNVLIVGPNQEIKNSLTEINSRTVYGLRDGAVVEIGEMMYKIVGLNTEILISIQTAPKQLRFENNVRDIPLQLQIVAAYTVNGGQDFEYDVVGTARFDASQQFLTTEFSTILPQQLGRYERLMFRPLDQTGEQTFFINQDPDLPINVRSQPSPYFWIIVS